MNPYSLFNQSITLYRKASYNTDGRPNVGTGVSHIARVQPVTKNRLMPNGEMIQVVAICYLKANVTVAVDDKVTFSSHDYKIFTKSIAVDGRGNTNHIKLELIEWKGT